MMFRIQQICLTVLVSMLMCGVGVGLVFAESNSQGSREWLGIYQGSEIPGFRVLRSEVTSVYRWGSVDSVIQAEKKEPLSAELVDACRSRVKPGVAIVNLRTVVALGSVPGPSSKPSTFISNGMYREEQGDCVLDAAPLSR
jgi:hypothetical protein